MISKRHSYAKEQPARSKYYRRDTDEFWKRRARLGAHKIGARRQRESAAKDAEWHRWFWHGEYP